MAEVATVPSGVPISHPGEATPPDLVVQIDLGQRVVIVANLLLTPEATATSTWAAAGVAQVLDQWEGPGTVLVAGHLFDLRQGPEASDTSTESAVPGADHGAPDRAAAALAAHPRLAHGLRHFSA